MEVVIDLGIEPSDSYKLYNVSIDPPPPLLVLVGERDLLCG